MKPDHRHLYKVTVNMPVYRSVYYVVASSFDEAAGMVDAAETIHGATNGGIETINDLGAAFGEGGALLIP